MHINLTATNMNTLATRVAETATKMGFTKNGKAMAPSQGLKLMAALAGYREEHSFVAALKSEEPAMLPYTSDKSEMKLEMDRLENLHGYEHPYYSRADWQQDVSEGNTRLGYWEWVVHALESNGGEEEHCSDCSSPLGDDSWDGKCGNCADHHATVEDLEDEWGDEHGFYSREDWGMSQAIDGHDLGYWEWVLNRFAANGGAESHCSECGFHVEDPANLENGVCASCKGSKEPDSAEEAESMGINLADLKFWVKTHYTVDFDNGRQAEREDWMHSYRQYNGLTPPDSMAYSAIDALRKVADSAYEDYDFGEHLVVAGDNGWEWTTGESAISKVVFLEDTRTPDLPTIRKVFVVNVVNGIAQDIYVRD